MRSLFFKIFAWFWLANILVVGILFMTMGPPHEPKSLQFRTLLGDQLELYGKQAVNALDTNGKSGLAAFLAELEQRTGLKLLVLDAGNRDVLDTPVAPDVTSIAEQTRLSAQTELVPNPERGMLYARVADQSADRAYVFVGRLSRPPFRFFSSPYQIALRVLAPVIVGGLLCYGLAHYLTAPLRRLRQSSRALAGGQLHTRVGPEVNSRHDEIGDLGQDFNFMAARLESLVSSQQRLILDISHELRSPLARLNLALGLAAKRAGVEAQSALDRIGLETERLNDLIERMLVLSRLEHRETAGQPVDVDLADMLRDIVADASFEAHAHRRDAILVHCDACTMTGVPHLLRSAIDNVVRNALRYTAENTAVEVSLEVVAQPHPQALIRIRDHGSGVPEDALERIFRPFCRVGDDRNRQTGGVGLGLAIARQAVRFHGGSIVASNALDGGLIVDISVPLNGHASGCDTMETLAYGSQLLRDEEQAGGAGRDR